MAQELEIKLSVAQPDLDRVVDWLLGQPNTYESGTLQLGNTYYDTPDGDLNRQKIALRIRKLGDRHIQTLKTRGEFVDGAHRRQEWEWPLIGTTLNMGLIADTPVGQSVNLARLQPVFETNFQRRVVMIEQGESLVEVAIDSGEIVADGQSRPLSEVEFELKAGDASLLLAWARRLADEVPVFLNLVSKAEQGYYLAGLYHPVSKAEQNAELSVNEFLFLLSVSWLTGQSAPVNGDDFRAIARMAGERGVGELYQRVFRSLAEGNAIGDMASSKELGQLQLAIAAA
ncbi:MULTISPECIES: CYTH domain-containing protein [Marinobacter]|jgi:inorganic triphosphatase YgiF|uniref:Adenylate cyclase n=1 Tax=Marinobacter salarius TaxID=1420917 RepID=W5Z2N8_9GAMM|nr:MULTISPECIES: CYTH domain-containing protein [Marinobacter]AHI32778.1 adenylate cyclase [Marinobacter salarius]KXJ43880.1 MAG: adenylate cyclase [Marinobacter sp. Hex_13]MBJ7278195.1 CYTH domain-containing protein [Marinobacter salarius]MBS8232319.1 CYTH domain-containing protein [Marinobacter salarius]MDM8180086.1 CYTH domain-containing protein [Marinobacter salarius]|tara:strand:+ start:79 stop:936 length:858 start_codon:yes stop_codon:yes gene_type:complete